MHIVEAERHPRRGVEQWRNREKKEQGRTCRKHAR